MNLPEVIKKPKSLFYKLRNEVRCVCAHYPQFYFSQREKLYGYVDNQKMIDSDTEIVIDGYRSSANTFALKAFRMAQTREVKIAHHTHDPSQLIAAATANVPAIVLIRNPEEVVLSCTTRFYDISNKPEQEIAKLIYHLISDYIYFYRRIIKYKKSYIVADFKELTSSYDSIIKKVNHKYGVNFTPFYCNEQNINQVFFTIDKKSIQIQGHLNEKAVARPSAKRKANKKFLRPYFNRLRINKRLQSSYNLYREITS